MEKRLVSLGTEQENLEEKIFKLMEEAEDQQQKLGGLKDQASRQEQEVQHEENKLQQELDVYKRQGQACSKTRSC